MKRGSRNLAGLFAVVLAASGCGGGGSDPQPAPAPAPTPAPAPAAASTLPLAITPASATIVATRVPNVGDSVLAVAQFAVDSARRFALPGPASPLVSTCPNGGLMTITFADNDANGVASPGDRITVVTHDCSVPVKADVVNGTMQVDLLAPSMAGPGSLSATVASVDGLRFGAAGGVGLLGSMHVDWSASDLLAALRVTAAAADDLRLVTYAASATGAAVVESVHLPDLSKTLKYDEARAVVSIGLRYESQLLQGSFNVATSVPLQAYLDTYPEIGRIEVTGAAGSKLVLTPNYVSNSAQFKFALDADGDGAVDASGSVAWSDASSGFLWWDGRTALDGYAAGAFDTRPFATTDFYPSSSFRFTTASDSAMRLQFSRPLASGAPTLFFRFVDQGSGTSLSTPLVNVAATGAVHGALIVVTPAAPLHHGRYYVLQSSLDGVDWNAQLTVQDALGNSSTGAWQSVSFATPGNLKALGVVQGGVLAGASDQLILDAQSSTSSLRAIAGYQWTQVSGTPLRLGATTSVQATASWGANAPTGVEYPVVRLTVTDTAGDTESTDVTLSSANLAGSAHVLYFRSAAGDVVGGGATAVYTDSVAQFQQSIYGGSLYASVYTTNYASSWSLTLADADGTPLHVGSYDNAVRAYLRVNQNGVDFSGGGRSCNQVIGRFDVLEIQVDAYGAVQHLAVDFEQHCETATAPALLGSYRFNSSVPIRR